MGSVLSQAVRPAVVECTVIDAGAVRVGRIGGGSWGNDGRGGRVGGGVGAMISGSLCSELATPLLVSLGEVALEGSHGPSCFIAFPPAFDACSEHAGPFQGLQGEMESGGVTDRFIAGCSEALDFANANPQVFNGVVGRPIGSETVSVGFEIIGGDRRVGCLEVCKHGGASNVGEAHLVIREDGKVEGRNSSDDLLFKFFIGSLVERMFGERGCVLTVRFSDLGAGRVPRMEGGCTWVDWYVEGLAGPSEIFGGRHDDGEVAMCTATSSRVYGACVSVELALEELQGGMGRFSWNEGKGRVGEGEHRCGAAHFSCLVNGSVAIHIGSATCDDVVVLWVGHSSASVAVVWVVQRRASWAASG